ncbi:hypothetical protein ND748_03125 [Frankia sp. AiPs1]|uniref:hypothetical protein n=1 Tax=Frankia sp. AiPs1 TaxID=573493 RepID=UPI0020441CE9|nr:hypothetical protein [Frankia sp. AiPs1]MCM3920669.1 hypothetical protein [Frankia sp. AiPs1]
MRILRRYLSGALALARIVEPHRRRRAAEPGLAAGSGPGLVPPVHRGEQVPGAGRAEGTEKTVATIPAATITTLNNF